MEYCQTSSYVSQQLLDETTAQSRARHPLTDAAGNAQLQALAGISLPRHDNKAIQPQVDRPMYSIPVGMVPSQPPRQRLGNTLELRRQNSRRLKHARFTSSRNPIANSPQYKAYRDRQSREGNADDQKWPEVLEDAFLNALIDIPIMGRRKFSMRGKPHGRNELISEYLWIAYLQSLPAGQKPDKSMERKRKQVSSHIQVLKGFMKDNPHFESLFPKRTTPDNGFEDSFKNNPCLRALQDGRIWNSRATYEAPEHSNRISVQSHGSIKPVLFWLLITSSSVPDDMRGRGMSEADLYRDGVVAHQYTRLHSQKKREHLENINHWRGRFPDLERKYSVNEINCEIIHMDVSLELMRGHARVGAELVTRMEMTMPGPEFGRHQWQTVTSLVKPEELCCEDRLQDPSVDHKTFHMEVVDVNEGETRIKVPFPANAWAHAFTCLTNVDESRRAQSIEGGPSNISTRSSREYVEQLSMYQEVQSSPDRGIRFFTRAIVIWTFHKTRNGDQGSATWRYIDPLPSRRTCMSPSPQPSHHVSAAMNENFNSWADTTMRLQNPNMLDTFVQGLATPPQTAASQSPFTSQGYGYPNHHFDLNHEALSFMSNATVDSESTMVESDTAANLDSFLSNTDVNLGEFDHNSNGWHMPHVESFDAGSAWADYNVPASTQELGWEADPKAQAWQGASLTKPAAWIDEANGKHDEQWNDSIAIPTQQGQNYVEATLQQKLLPWVEQHAEVNGEASHNDFNERNGIPLPDISNGDMDGVGAKEQVWNMDHEEFDYDQLAEQLK